ncbi:MAG: response regulator, partial [Burkholderiaceae bacterium]|nr:response regulator [Burkholderiaceae bacterium]
MAMADDTAETVRRALIVDDDPLARTLIAASFAEIGFEVSTAGDGLEALSLAGAQTFSCVVLDVQMPGPSGFEVCRELRRMPQYRTIPILIQTGLDDHRSIEQAFEAGASDYLTKPVNDALLRHRIRFVMKAAELVGELEDKRAKLDEALNLAHLGHWEYLYDSGT